LYDVLSKGEIKIYIDRLNGRFFDTITALKQLIYNCNNPIQFSLKQFLNLQRSRIVIPFLRVSLAVFSARYINQQRIKFSEAELVKRYSSQKTAK
jgi:hypothetical protein